MSNTEDYPSLIQCRIELPLDQANQVSDILLELGALAVCMEDAQADTTEEDALFGEPGLEPEHNAWNNNVLVALFSTREAGEEILSEVPQELLLGQTPRYSVLPGQDWVRNTQAQFEPIEITPTFWIVPSWCERQANPGDVHLTLDPGLAFGTGSHPTTSLCLKWLCEHALKGQRVLDYGCGSGILGIAALKLGATEAIGVDIDPQAVQSTGYNAQRNQVTMPVGLPGFEQAKGQFPVVVANILSSPLKMLAPALCAHVAPAGHLVLSGVLTRQAEEVMEFYRTWMHMEVWAEKEGWVCLHGTPKNASA